MEGNGSANGNRRILLVRHGRLGENLFWTGVPAAVRRAHPADSVHVLSNRPEVWEGNPDVAAVHDLPEIADGARGGGALERALRPLRSLRFDAAVLNNEGPAIAAAIEGLGIPLVLRHPEWDLLPGGGTLEAARREGWTRVHRSEAAVANAARLGVAPPPWPMHYEVPAEARRTARERLHRLGVPEGAPLVVFNLGTDQTRRLRVRRADRTWPLENLLDCARSLMEEPGRGDLRVYFNQHSARDFLAAWKAVRVLPRGRASFLRRRAGLPLIAAILRESACVVSSDTGLLHLGLALRVPTVGVFGTRVAPEATISLGAERWSRMLGPDPDDPRGIASVTGERVAAAVREVLRAPAQPAAEPPGDRNTRESTANLPPPRQAK